MLLCYHGNKLIDKTLCHGKASSVETRHVFSGHLSHVKYVYVRSTSCHLDQTSYPIMVNTTDPPFIVASLLFTVGTLLHLSFGAYFAIARNTFPLRARSRFLITLLWLVVAFQYGRFYSLEF